MNAAAHLARADHLLEQAHGQSTSWDANVSIGLALEAIGHVLAAIAIEVGAPHDNAPSGGGSGPGQQ